MLEKMIDWGKIEKVEEWKNKTENRDFSKTLQYQQILKNEFKSFLK